MKNREKYIDDILSAHCETTYLRCGQDVCPGISCTDCKKANLEWLKAEYKEPETDWSTVSVDTLIEVRNGGAWEKRYFAKYEDGKVHAWDGGRTSKTARDNTDYREWDKARLVEE